MSRKTLCDLCGVTINGCAAKVIVVSSEFESRFGQITRNDALDICDDCYMRIREVIDECKELGKHER